MYQRILSSFPLGWFSIQSTLKANIYLNCKSKRDSCILFLLSFSLILKIINFQWQLIISDENSESMWLFLRTGLAKCILIEKVFLLYAFQSILPSQYVKTTTVNVIETENNIVAQDRELQYFLVCRVGFFQHKKFCLHRNVNLVKRVSLCTEKWILLWILSQSCFNTI